jgi:hypothetical protein
VPHEEVEQKHEEEKKTHVQEDEVDEENMFVAREIIKKVEKTQDLKLQNKLMIFLGSQFCFYDFGNGKWDIGDLVKEAENYPVPQNCAITRVERTVNRNNKFNVIISGGIVGDQTLTANYALSFEQGELNGQQTVEGKLSEKFADFATGRFLHQLVIVKKSEKGRDWHLVALGGKSTNRDQISLNTVESFELGLFLMDDNEYFEERFEAQKKIGGAEEQSAEYYKWNDDKLPDLKSSVNWESCTNMTNARHSFAATVIDDRYIYVYGGIIGAMNGSHKPILADHVVERYDAFSSNWSPI